MPLSSRPLQDDRAGRDKKKHISTKKWIILAATSNQAEDLTGAIAVASIQRYYNTGNVIKAVEETMGVGEIERRSSSRQPASQKEQ